MAPRRALVPLAALILLIGVYVAEGAVGASVVDRYLLGAATVLLLFCAVSFGGWAMLEPGSKLRRAWIAGAVVLVAYGAASAANTLSLTSLRTTLAEHEDFHEGLAVALESPPVKAQLRRCPLLSLPDNKLIPDARWILGSVGQQDIVARSQARADVEHALARAGGPHPLGQRGGLPARQRGVRRRDRRRRRRPARPGSARGLQAHLHQSLLRGVCQLLRSRRSASVPRAGPTALGGGRGPGSRSCCSAAWGCACGVCGRGCPTSTTSTRPTISCRTPSKCSRRGRSTRTTSPTRPRSRTCCTSCSPSPTAARAAWCARSRGTPPRCTRWRASPPPCSAPRRCGCCTRPARGCSTARVGLLAAAIEAVAFLPVFYAHLALNDAPTLAPLTLSLLGTAGVLRKGRARDHLLAGVGLGLACASKYTAGIVDRAARRGVVARYLRLEARRAGRWRRALGGLALAGVLRAARVPDREPLRAARLQRLPRRTGPPVDALRRSPGQARRTQGGRRRSTTCGRSPGASAGCRRWPRSAER